MSCAGLVPVVAPVERAGLHGLIARQVRVPGSAGSSPVIKVLALIAGKVAGADRIDSCGASRLSVEGR